MSNDVKKLRGPFTALYTDATKKCPAWYAMDPRARALVVEIKLRFDRDAETAVGMSVRQAAKLLNTTDFHIAVRMLKQAVYYGFLIKIADGYLGANGKGIATQWRLTDEPYLGKPATLDFLRWNGILFEEKLGSEKTKSRCGRHNRPVVADTTPRCARHNRDLEKARKISKIENQPPVVSDTTFLRSSQSSTAAEPVAAPAAEPTPEPEPSSGRNAERATKAEQALAEMITVLRTFFGNRTTSTDWFQHMQSFCGAGWSRPSFKRRLKTLKHRKWISIVGQPDADLDRAPEGSLFEATVIAPGAPGQLGSEPGRSMNGGADAAAETAKELLARLGKGRTAA